MDWLDRVGSGFAGADSDDIIECLHTDISIAWASGLGAFLDYRDDFVALVIADEALEFNHLDSSEGDRIT